MTVATRRRTIAAHQLRECMLIDFEDDNPAMVSQIKHMAHSVLFTARGTEFRLDRYDQVIVVIRMEVV